VQRRRRKKAAPKNIFGTGSQSTSAPISPKTKRPQTTRKTPQRAPPSVPGAKPRAAVKKTPPAEPKEIVEEPIVEEEPQSEPEPENEPEPVQEITEDIVENQILGKKDSKKISVQTEPEKEAEEPDEDGRSLKAREIIQNSMLKASKAVAQEARKPRSEGKKASTSETKEAPKKPQKKFRNKVSSYQPANRAKRLDRSRHMEYKYEMRGLLVEIGVEEEHRSNLLATVWARGERQTSNEAKNFLVEKLSEGVIDEEQMKRLEKMVDGYTIRR
jgi:hypothetical protein